MVLRLALVLLFFNCVRTAENFYEHELIKDAPSASVQSRMPWLQHYAVKLRKRDELSISPVIKTEGNSELEHDNKPVRLPAKSQPKTNNQTLTQKLDVQIDNSRVTGNISEIGNDTAIHTPLFSKYNAPVLNSTASKDAPSQLNLSNPGVLKRGFIVFGAFGLMAVAYYVFFKRKDNKNNTNSIHNTNDTNQFRYGVLQSDDQRDNLELSRIPLTMDSDEDDDEDLEIFDLEQKKKSLSYVNLQPKDDNFDVSGSNFSEIPPGQDGDNLLLDIDTNDTLIMWSNNNFNSNAN